MFEKFNYSHSESVINITLNKLAVFLTWKRTLAIPQEVCMRTYLSGKRLSLGDVTTSKRSSSAILDQVS